MFPFRFIKFVDSETIFECSDLLHIFKERDLRSIPLSYYKLCHLQRLPV
jgi:hypothetical protein